MGVRKATQHYATGATRRERILDAADELFRAAGSGAPSVQDIATAAGLSRPGLLRYFSSKAEVLDALVDRYEHGAEQHPEPDATPGSAGIVARARRNAAVPGYVERFTSLAGEAAPADHPGHARMARRYRELRTFVAGHLAAELPGTCPPDTLRDLADCVVAGWEGLNLLALYSDTPIDPAACLGRHLRRLTASPDGRAPRPAGAVDPAERSRVFRELQAEDVRDFREHRGYAPGQERRRRIVEAATTLFGVRGFHTISMREIAKSVGISHSTLLYHFPGKDELLRAVLTHHDYVMVTGGNDADPGDMPARLAAVVETARRVACDAPGLMELFAVVSAEAVAPGHPAHAYFATHFAMSRRYLVTVFAYLEAQGELAAGHDPAQEGLWFLALCEGLQRLRLYDPGVDAPRLLAADVARVIVAPGH